MGIVFTNEDQVFAKMGEDLIAAAHKGMEDACFIVEADSKKDCPLDTGMLKQSISSEVEYKKEENKIIGQIGSNLEYAPYVHQGTGIYAVEGNGRKQVPWHYKDAKGRWHSTKGIKPKPFIFDAMEKNKQKITETVREALK